MGATLSTPCGQLCGRGVVRPPVVHREHLAGVHHRSAPGLVPDARLTVDAAAVHQAGDGESIQPKVTRPVRSFGSMLASA
jgi:hypothetical protein